LRFYVGVRITGVIDEERATGDSPARVWGWCFQTLEGHLGQGRLSYEVIKNLSTGRVTFRVAGYSRPAPIENPVIRLGSWLFGRRTQERFYRNISRGWLTWCGQRSMADPCRPRWCGPTASCWHLPGSGRIRWSAWPVDGSTPVITAGPGAGRREGGGEMPGRGWTRGGAGGGPYQRTSDVPGQASANGIAKRV
jgi:hypothetical protein